MHILETDPSSAFEKMKNGISEGDKTSFISAFIIGLLTHLYMFTNKLMGRDELLCLFSSNDMLKHGRWLLKFPSAVSSDFSLPWVNGILSVFFIALVAVLVCRLLNITAKWQRILASAALITFPTVANTFSYMFVADPFFFSCFLAALAAYLTDRCKRGWIAGIILVIASMGIYQGYICFMIPLLSMRYLQHLYDPNETDKEHLRILFRYSLTVIIGIAGYIFITKVLLHINDVSLGAGQNLDAMGKLTLSDLPVRVFDAVYYFIEFWFRTSMVQTYGVMRFINLIIFACIIFAFCFPLFTEKRSALSKTFILLILLLTPVLFNTVRLMGASTIHWVMLYSFSLVFILLLVAVNTFKKYSKCTAAKCVVRTGNLLQYTSALILFVTSFTWAVNANQLYFAMQLYYENCYALSERVVYDAEHLDGYYTNIPMAVEGVFNAGNYIPTKSGVFESIGKQSALQSAYDYVLIFDDAHFRAFAMNILGFCTAEPDPKALASAMASEEYQEMPYYPESGSVKIINGILLVKASD